MAMQPMSVLSPGEFPQASLDCVKPSAAVDQAQEVVSCGWSTRLNWEMSVVSTMVVAVDETGPWQNSLAATFGVGKSVGAFVGTCVGETVGAPRQRPVRSEQVPVPSQKVETVDKSAILSS